MGQSRLYLIILGTLFVSHAGFAQQAPGKASPTGPLSELGQTLDDNGLRIRAQILEEPAMNATGGVRQNSTYSGQLQMGADFDLNKLMGLEGATFHQTTFLNMGQSLATKDVGVNYALQESYKYKYEHLHPGVFSYEQNLFQDQVNFVVGRLGMTPYFANLSEFCNFLNGAVCGVPTILKTQSGLTLPPSSTWGGRVLYNVTSNWSIAAGANEVNPTASPSYGLDWSVNKSTGVAIPVQLTYQETAKENPYPFQIKVGNIANTATHSDPFFNTKGKSLGLNGGAARQERSAEATYIEGDKTVWRRGNDSTSNIQLFGAYVQQVDTTEVYRNEAAVGAVWTGALESRPYDKIGFEVFQLNLTSEEREYLRDARLKAGGSGMNDPHEFEFEVNYTYQVSPSIQVMPSVQYIINPDNVAIPKTKFVSGNAVVLGVQFGVDLAGLLGLPSTGLKL